MFKSRYENLPLEGDCGHEDRGVCKHFHVGELMGKCMSTLEKVDTVTELYGCVEGCLCGLLMQTSKACLYCGDAASFYLCLILPFSVQATNLPA